MGYTSQDDITTQLTAGKSVRPESTKQTTPAHTAGGWHLLAGLSGSPQPTTWPGTTLNWTGCNESTGDGTTVFGIQHGGNPGGSATKHLLSIGAQVVAAAGAPWQLKLVDLIGYYKLTGTDVTGTGARTLVGTPTHRYGNGDGVQACIVSTTAPTGGGPNVSASSYTNAAGTTTRAFQGTPSCGAAADAYASRVLHSGNASGRYGPFLPMQGGDTGVRSIQSITLSGGTAYTGSGVLAICLVKPLADIAVPVTGMWSERDLVTQLRSLPKIADGACLAWMMFSTGATTNLSPVSTALDIGWGG